MVEGTMCKCTKVEACDKGLYVDVLPSCLHKIPHHYSEELCEKVHIFAKKHDITADCNCQPVGDK